MKKVFYVFGLALMVILAFSSCSDNESVETVKFKCVFDALDWGKGTTTYVIGHKSPDTDAACSAITYAYLMNALGYKCEARVAGKLNNETKMVLQRFGIEVPKVMDNADGERMIMTDHSELQHAIEGNGQGEDIADNRPPRLGKCCNIGSALLPYNARRIDLQRGIYELQGLRSDHRQGHGWTDAVCPAK